MQFVVRYVGADSGDAANKIMMIVACDLHLLCTTAAISAKNEGVLLVMLTKRLGRRESGFPDDTARSMC